MRIKKVEILGFKSFVDKVSLDFTEGTTAIVGPNGCGKSNIVDAIRWAMGEQSAKNLRGRSMEDIIFGGSEIRKPLGMAEVSLTFSNEAGTAPQRFRDYAEICVTRRLYRDGESEYLINKTPCRLLDITELFMDTGVGARAYSIIEQGKIGMILNSKPEDRRFLIEEAAGVTKYKARKKSALRKIDATRQNMIRLSDIVSEVRRQMNSLKRQAQKAERFKTLREELKEIETRFARRKYQSLCEDISTATRLEGEEKVALESLSASLAEGEGRIEEERLLQTVREKDLSAAQERVYHLTAEIQKVEGRIEMGEKEVQNIVRQKERLLTEGEEIARRMEEYDRQEEALRAEERALADDLERETRRLVDEESCAEELLLSESDLTGRLDEARQMLYALLTELSRMGSLQDEAQRRTVQMEERVSRNRSEAVSVREQMSELLENADRMESLLVEVNTQKEALLEEKEALEETIRVLQIRVHENETALNLALEDLNRQRSRLESLKQLEENLEGYGGGVKALLGDDSFRHRFTRMLADLLDVPEEAEAAVEAVLGDRLQALPVSGVGDAIDALAFLSRQGGRCTFLLPGFSGAEASPWPEGRPLVGLIRLRDETQVSLQGLFSGVYLVESLTPFLQGGLPANLTLVTPEGALLSGRGELTGGGRDSLDRGLLHKKREIRDLEESVGIVSESVDRLRAERIDIKAALDTAEGGLRDIASELHRKELEIVDRQKDLLRLREDAGRLQERLEVLCLEEDQLHEEDGDLKRQLTEISGKREEKERLKGEQEGLVARLQEEAQVRRREMEVVRERVTTLKVAVTTLRERSENVRNNLELITKQREELRGRTVMLKGLDEEGADEQERLRETEQKLRVELDLLFRKREEEKERFTKLREAFDEAAAGLDEREALLKGVRGRLDEARERLAVQQVTVRELSLEAEHLRKAILDRYRLDLDGLFAIDLEPEPEGGEERIDEIRRLIDEMGEVNLTAIEEFRELEERWDFLTTQQDDLRASLEGLQSAIAKINRTTRKRFRETFDQVNEKFREVFPRLFRGGKAELRLSDESDLLETGIDIVVQPPGKKLQNVTLLSGGEKALTAVALIFSIFLIKPSPFCMLDEVDAPLDDANIGRFNEMIREMSSISQFVIITHNKRTMEIADTLYGVTMEDPGVSKLVSVRINDF